MMEVRALAIPDVLVVTPRRFADGRGVFSETWQRARYADAGITADFVQDNLSVSTDRGTLRGLHFQAPPFAQAKLVQCVAGRVFDVAVDLRAGSPTYGRWVGAELGADTGAQIYVPEGFAHGFLTLEPGCIVTYKVSAPYDPGSEGGLAWDDAALAIDWPETGTAVKLSERDRRWPPLAGLDTPFTDKAP